MKNYLEYWISYLQELRFDQCGWDTFYKAGLYVCVGGEYKKKGVIFAIQEAGNSISGINEFIRLENDVIEEQVKGVLKAIADPEEIALLAGIDWAGNLMAYLFTKFNEMGFAH